jgi:hypothetical protein
MVSGIELECISSLLNNGILSSSCLNKPSLWTIWSEYRGKEPVSSEFLNELRLAILCGKAKVLDYSTVMYTVLSRQYDSLKELQGITFDGRLQSGVRLRIDLNLLRGVQLVRKDVIKALDNCLKHLIYTYVSKYNLSHRIIQSGKTDLVILNLDNYKVQYDTTSLVLQKDIMQIGVVLTKALEYYDTGEAIVIPLDYVMSFKPVNENMYKPVIKWLQETAINFLNVSDGLSDFQYINLFRLIENDDVIDCNSHIRIIFNQGTAINKVLKSLIDNISLHANMERTEYGLILKLPKEVFNLIDKGAIKKIISEDRNKE